MRHFSANARATNIFRWIITINHNQIVIPFITTLTLCIVILRANRNYHMMNFSSYVRMRCLNLIYGIMIRIRIMVSFYVLIYYLPILVIMINLLIYVHIHTIQKLQKCMISNYQAQILKQSDKPFVSTKNYLWIYNQKKNMLLIISHYEHIYDWAEVALKKYII